MTAMHFLLYKETSVIRFLQSGALNCAIRTSGEAVLIVTVQIQKKSCQICMLLSFHLYIFVACSVVGLFVINNFHP